MARNLAHKREFIEGLTSDIPTNRVKKGDLNRRELLQVGTAATALAVGVGVLSSEGSAGTEESETMYMTDFSDYNE